MTNPAEYTWGLEELIKQHRLYLGLSEREMARALSMARRSYQRIETGDSACPPGLLDSIDGLVDRFDADVTECVHKAVEMLGDSDSVITVTIDPDDEGGWNRAVLGRAAVESGLIMPKLVAEQKEAG